MLILIVANKSCVFIFSFLFTGENGTKSYETCLSLIQEEKNGKSKIDIDFQFLILNWKLNGRMTHGPGIPNVSPAYRGIKMEWLWSERTGVLIHFSNSCKNDKRNSNLFFNNKQYKNEKRNSNPFFKSDAKTKNENWNSYPFFKVKRKRKKKYEVQIRFSKLSENEKQKAKFKSVFQCHAKTKNVNGIWIPFSMPSKNGWH